MRRVLPFLMALLPAVAHAQAFSVATFDKVARLASLSVRVQGYDAAVASGSYILVNPLSVAATQFQTTADEVLIKNATGNANDTAAGSGCREVTFCGLNDSWVRTCEAEATAGASASTKTTAKFFRLTHAYCSASGTSHAANTGAVTIETEAGTTIATIEAGLGYTRQGFYSIPDGYTGYLRSVRITVDDTTEQADVRVLTVADQSDVSAPVSAVQVVDQFVNVGTVGPVERVYDVLPAFTEKSDVWVEASGAGGASEVAVEFELFLVQDAQ